jgi:hypothetical protein
MTTVEDTQDDETVEEIKKAQREAKREKTKYGPQITKDE